MAKKKEEIKDALFKKGELVRCINFDGLSVEVINWLNSREDHPIKHVYSAKFEPILILEPIEGIESPKLDGKLYPFMSERFVKVTLEINV